MPPRFSVNPCRICLDVQVQYRNPNGSCAQSGRTFTTTASLFDDTKSTHYEVLNLAPSATPTEIKKCASFVCFFQPTLLTSIAPGNSMYSPNPPTPTATLPTPMPVPASPPSTNRIKYSLTLTAVLATTAKYCLPNTAPSRPLDQGHIAAPMLDHALPAALVNAVGLFVVRHPLIMLMEALHDPAKLQTPMPVLGKPRPQHLAVASVLAAQPQPLRMMCHTSIAKLSTTRNR